MSRFEETLQRDLRQIADRATPSPDAWNTILSRIADQDPIQETEIIMLTENPMTTRRWPFVAAAAAVIALVVGGIALISRDDGAQSPADTPLPTVAPTTPEPEPAAETLALPVLIGSDVPAGRYSADMLGVPVSFDVPDASPPWTQVFKTDVGFAVGSGTSTWIGAKRIGSFYGAEQAQDEDMTGLGSIPPDGVDTWIEANGMIVDQSSEVTVGGRAAQYRQVRIPADAGDCDEGFQPCISSVSSSADLQDVDPYPFVIYSERPWSFWIVDMGDFEPLWIAATTDQPDHQAWLDELAPMIESIELGEPAPAVEGGTALLPLRTDVSASYSGTRTVGPLLDDGTREVITEHTVEGDLVGELSAVGVQVTPSNGYDDLTFTGTIDGLGSGTLTMRQEWTASASGTITTTTVVTGGTGDFEGFTGRMITSVDAPDESGEVPIYTGRLTLQLVIPQSG
jgi:hypothetical protein